MLLLSATAPQSGVWTDTRIDSAPTTASADFLSLLLGSALDTPIDADEAATDPGQDQQDAEPSKSDDQSKLQDPAGAALTTAWVLPQQNVSALLRFNLSLPQGTDDTPASIDTPNASENSGVTETAPAASPIAPAASSQKSQTPSVLSITEQPPDTVAALTGSDSATPQVAPDTTPESGTTQPETPTAPTTEAQEDDSPASADSGTVSNTLARTGAGASKADPKRKSQTNAEQASLDLSTPASIVPSQTVPVVAPASPASASAADTAPAGVDVPTQTDATSSEAVPVVAATSTLSASAADTARAGKRQQRTTDDTLTDGSPSQETAAHHHRASPEEIEGTHSNPVSADKVALRLTLTPSADAADVESAKAAIPTAELNISLKRSEPAQAKRQAQVVSKTASSSANRQTSNPSSQATQSAASSAHDAEDKDRRNESEREDKRAAALRETSAAAPKDSPEATQQPLAAEIAPAAQTAARTAPAVSDRTQTSDERRADTSPSQEAARVVAPESKTTVPQQSAPLREIALKVPGTTEKTVDLRIAEDRGKVHVEVRTSDPELASALKDNVGDLVERLDHTGYRAESVSTREEIRSAASPNRQDSENGGQTGGQGGGQTGQEHQQGQGRGNRPRWLEEIVKNFHAGVQEQENDEQ